MGGKEIKIREGARPKTIKSEEKKKALKTGKRGSIEGVKFQRMRQSGEVTTVLEKERDFFG